MPFYRVRLCAALLLACCAGRSWAQTPISISISAVAPNIELKPGDRVTHDKFGLGTVVATQGEGDKAQATIDFGATGTKQLLLRYAPVEKL